MIGGGPAGMMAAYAAAKRGAEVTLFEQNEKLGKKLYITGKGRCNLTNDCETPDFFTQVVSNPKFLYSSIYGFSPAAVTGFFETHGLALKTERGGRVFPESDHSSDVIRTMERALKEAGVNIRLKTRLCGILTKSVADDNAYDGGDEHAEERQENCNVSIAGISVRGVVPRNGKESGTYCENGAAENLDADAVILAGGGLSYPATGADGSLIDHAKKLGHGITESYPALVPLNVKEHECGAMQGLSLKNVSVSLMIGKRKIYEGFGEMLFTHFGVSGPLILSASSLYSRKYAGQEADLMIDLKPALTDTQLDERLQRDFSENPNKEFHSILRGLVPGKLAEIFPVFCGIPAEKKIHDITKAERLRLRDTLKNLRFTVTGTRGFDEAIITSGGIRVKEIDPSTMQSKLIKGLYFAGEMIDVDAYTGGYNLQIAWSTGYLAGQSAAGV